MTASRDRPRRGRSSVAFNPIDVHVGSRVRQRRLVLHVTQEGLADGLGVSFQQVQKYERGVNRISASRLLALSAMLDVPIQFFYEDADPAMPGAKPEEERADQPGDPTSGEPLGRPETAALVNAYHAIRNTTLRRRLLDLAASLANASGARAGKRRPTKSLCRRRDR